MVGEVVVGPVEPVEESVVGSGGLEVTIVVGSAVAVVGSSV